MAAPATTRIGHFVDGQTRYESSESIDVFDPASEEVIGSVPAGTRAEVDSAVAAARRAFPEWSARPVAERAEVVRAISNGIAARRDAIAADITADVGAPITFATKVQAVLPAATSEAVADLLSSGEFSFREEIGNSLVEREPVGVVAAITPWNYPLHQIMAKIAPALAAGCTVVLKPSEVAPLCTRHLVDVLTEAGVPAGVVNIVHGTGPEVGAALAGHEDVDMVSFTGSTRGGRAVSAAAADTIKRVALELGGKSANVVLDDADLGKAVKLGVANAFLNGGQSCNAWTRMLVPESLHDEAVSLACEAAAKYEPGDPTDGSTRLGPLVSETQRDKVVGFIRSGVESGATLAFGGPERPDDRDTGYFVRPTVFAGVRPDVTVAQEEIFGPVLCVIPYSDEDDAVRIANSTVYGLAGAVFSGSDERALSVARRMRTGQVDINGGAFNPLAPFGGYKQSGTGREFGKYGIEEFCEVKSIQR
ncbi:aldehyde dehydrogenase (NAD+) [Haloechinothrix alba]|uniref:aldehyde dehydrogenase (NAD(+)) n=1 Tax=Haloechinothrix alba TaxID=664784 RepID=A0A238XN20_9PSEU|nr:aldehyde dehydrogenase family protein [Haloechinothrix alba]SNR59961.1 aldehyde dehydrogenase (NAD+) [Haloechinothrix alba]